MKTLHEQNHYEILELSRSAGSEEIERAYRLANSAFGQGSLACYSVFDERDATAIRDRIETAYRVLSNGEARVAYDRSISGSAAAVEPGPEIPHAFEPEGWRETDVPAVSAEPELPGASESFRELEAAVEEGDGEFDGATLRRARLRRGIELEGIADITKVSIANLRHIEEDNYEDLPATVYVRGFVGAYASTIGLDPKRVAASYVARLVETETEGGRSRFPGRR
jgi:curved DNA-binding protein CbpA